MVEVGSDTTAVALAAAINAKYCYICSDVEGVYTTDPKRVKNAKKLDNLSYDEMLDISNEGARVLHNRCIEIAEKFNIPIITKSTFNTNKGSIISNTIEDNSIKSIVKNDNLSSIILQANDSQKDNLLYTVYEILIKNNIFPIQYIDKDMNKIEFIINNSMLNIFNKLIEKEFKNYIISSSNISRISIIGYGLTNDNIRFQKILDTLKSLKLNIKNIDISNTKLGITFDKKIDDSVLNILHEILFK